MTLFSILPFAAAASGILLAVLGVLRKKRSLSGWCFAAGMAVLGVHNLFTGWMLRAAPESGMLQYLALGLVVEAFAPAAWLAFSLTYSRGDYKQFLARFRISFATLALLPIGLALVFRRQLFLLLPPAGETPLLSLSPAAKVLNIALLVANVWILMNLEQTFRSAVGAMRWRIKFVILGLAVMFGARVYAQSQALLFSTYDTRWCGIESSGFLIGCALLVVGYVRTGFAELDIYPSRAVLGSSLTLLVAGGYLFIVGVLANLVARFGGAESFQLQAFVVLLAMAALALLLLSDRLRQRIRGFLARHFTRAQYDSVRIWTEFSRRLVHIQDAPGLCAISAKLISETFEVLSVTFWLLDEPKAQLVVAASTDSKTARNGAGPSAGGLPPHSAPFDLEPLREPWADDLRRLNPSTFPNGGHRWAVPLRAGGHSLGLLVLADRVNGAAYTAEQLQLLQCIADQVASVLVNLRLAAEVTRSRELEAFRTMSAFFVHDLKNAATSLNLMLKNLPVHFNDPAFREDALRGIGNTARRIDDMLARLAALRQRPELKPVQADLNQLVSEVLDGLDRIPDVELVADLQPVPNMLADRDQIRSVVSNLVLNARDALHAGGTIRVGTEQAGDSVVLTVADNGCGMSEAFVKDSLFRPFQSTKKKGLGIGMFQSRMVIEAHGGTIRVQSEAGKGSTFRVTLPAQPASGTGYTTSNLASEPCRAGLQTRGRPPGRRPKEPNPCPPGF